MAELDIKQCRLPMVAGLNITGVEVMNNVCAAHEEIATLQDHEAD